MDNTDLEELPIVYFHPRDPPTYGHFFADVALEPGSSSEDYAKVVKLFPKFVTIKDSALGYKISARLSYLITIISKDPEAYLTVNSDIGVEILIGEGSFTFPIGALYFVDFFLYHEGEVTIEYRVMSKDKEDMLSDNIWFNIVFKDRSGNDLICAVTSYTMRKSDKPVPVVRDRQESRLTKILDYAEKLKRHGILHDKP